MNPTADSLASIRNVQQIFSVIASLHLNDFEYPPSVEPFNNTEFDYVIVGGGTAGSILANRLTEIIGISVLVIEPGDNPPIETRYPGLFGFTYNTSYDYSFDTINDGYTSQNLRGNAVTLVAGKMLGGTSCLNHLLCVRGNPFDYQRWANAVDDQSWNYDAILPYFIKSEKVTNKTILSSPTGSLHGTDGPVGLNIEHSDNNKEIIDAITELGYEHILDLNSNDTLGVAEPFYFIKDGVRSSMADCYLSPAKARLNLNVWKRATVTKIMFDENKNAIGVEVLNSRNETKIIKAKREVILAAGVVKTPQLLMLSGIGPEDDLKSFGIPVLSNLPVGKNLQDHVTALAMFKMGTEDKMPLSTAITSFPAPYILANKADDPNQSYPDYQVINLFMPKGTSAIFQVCASVIMYSNEICNQFHRANAEHNALLAGVFKLRPLSTGSIELNGTDPLANPLIRVGHYSDTKDLNDTAKYMLEYSKLLNTTEFRKANSSVVYLDLEKCNDIEKGTFEYWKCYALQMSCSIYHFCGTCAMGTVLDSKLQVKGVQNLRVVDASGLPHVPSGDNQDAVIAFAEKASDIIKDDYKKKNGLFGIFRT